MRITATRALAALAGLGVGLGAVLGGAILGATPASALEMQPGLWRFTQTTSAAGRGKTRAKTVCVTPAQAKDPARYFQPLGKGCAITSHSDFGGRIASTLRCQISGMVTEVSSTITFTSGSELSIATRMTSGTTEVGLRGSGQRLGECGARGRRVRRSQ